MDEKGRNAEEILPVSHVPILLHLFLKGNLAFAKRIGWTRMRNAASGPFQAGFVSVRNLV
jgi:hypothetical protein